jgi:DNA invertase Pin-like site-specific DNA recombinase
MFQMMGVFAEFERSMIVERVRSGVARAKATGTKSGKAFGRPRTAPEVEQRIRDALATPGRPGFHKIAAQFGVATGTVQRIAAGSPSVSARGNPVSRKASAKLPMACAGPGHVANRAHVGVILGKSQ